MRVEYSGVDPSERSRAAEPSSVPSQFDDERRRQMSGTETRPEPPQRSVEVKVSEEARAALRAERSSALDRAEERADARAVAR